MDPLVSLSPAGAAVHADAMEEQGHGARAEFIRTAMQFEALRWGVDPARSIALGQRLRELELEQWPEACGALSPEHAWVGWKHGLPTELGLTACDPTAGLAPLAAMPWLEHLALDLAVRTPLRGIEQLPVLRRLHFSWCVDVTRELGGATLPSVEFLSFDAPNAVQRGDLVALAKLRAPKLRRLHTRARDAAFVFSGIGAASWLPQLTAWTHVVSSRDELAPLLASPALRLAGPRLTLRVPAALAPGLALPAGVRLAIAREVPRYADPDWTHSGVELAVVPHAQGLQWLAPWVDVTPPDPVLSGNYTEDAREGSGAPSADVLSHCERWCALCESEHTLAQSYDCWGFDSSFERSRVTRWNYRCLDCGLYSSSRKSTVH